MGVNSSQYGISPNGSFLRSALKQPIDFWTNGNPQIRIDTSGSLQFFNSPSNSVEPNIQLRSSDTYDVYVESNLIHRVTYEGAVVSETAQFRNDSGQQIFVIETNDKGQLEIKPNSTIDNPLIFMEDDSLTVGIGTSTSYTELEIEQNRTPILNGTSDPISNQAGLTIREDNESSVTLFGDNSDDLNFAFDGVHKAFISDNDGSYNIQSDIRLKSDIQKLHPELNGVLNLAPKTYVYKGNENSDVSICFIAQEFEKRFPLLVSTKNDLKAVNHDDFSVIALKAIQEQQEIIESLEKIIAQFEQQ